MDFIFDWRSPASWVEPSVLSEVIASSPRLASRVWFTFDDLRPSCPSIPLRGYCHNPDVIFGDVFPAYHHRYKIEDHLRQSSSRLYPRGTLVMTWHSFLVGIGGLCSHQMFLRDSAPDATFAEEKSLTTFASQSRRYESCLVEFLP